MPSSPAPLLSFDIELATIIPPGDPWERHEPFDISVAATASSTNEIRHWYSKGTDGRPARCIDAAIARDMLRTLRDAQRAGVRVCAWNGLAFDLRWLCHAAGEVDLAAEVALDLYDPMFQFTAVAGHRVALAAVAEAMGIAQKKLMTGEQAPIEWQKGNHQLVMEYVAGDCQMTNQLVTAIERDGGVRWRKRNGGIGSVSMPQLRRVRDVLTDPPLPNPLVSTDSFWAWMKPYLASRK